MRKLSEFTQEQMQILLKNPNTEKITENRISLTLKKKKKILELNRYELTPREIVTKLGYDPVMLGKNRMRNMVRNVLRDAKSEYGLHEGYIRSARKRLDDEKIEQLECNPASYEKLKNEVIYLRKEVEFLKKISQQVISGKRGK